MHLNRIWGASPARKLMTVALILLFASQFFTYQNYSGHSMMTVGIGFESTTITHWFGQEEGTGWELHPHAYVIIAALVLIYLNEISETEFWSRWGWWLTIPLFWAASSPGGISAPGAKMGMAAVLLALAAAVANLFERRAARRALSPAP